MLSLAWESFNEPPVKLEGNMMTIVANMPGVFSVLLVINNGYDFHRDLPTLDGAKSCHIRQLVE